MSETIEARAIRWVLGNDTGVSSKAIMGVMMGELPSGAGRYPHDGQDFGRCVRLLDLIPEWRSRLPEMAALGPEWSALVDHWSELQTLHASPGTKIYERMKEILRPIEDARPGFIRLSDTMSVQFPDS